MIGHNDQLLKAALSHNARQEVSHVEETVEGVKLIQQHEQKDLADTSELPQHKSRCRSAIGRFEDNMDIESDLCRVKR